MINKLRRSDAIPRGSKTAAGQVALNNGRMGYNHSYSDGNRYVDAGQWVLKTAAYTAAVADAGKTLGFNSATGFAITLPAAADAPAARIKFVIATAGSGSEHSVDVVAADTIKGFGASGSGGDAFELTGWALGDSCVFESDGVSRWYLTEVTTAAVETGDIADNAVTNAKMADESVDSAEIVAGAVDLAHMSANSVDSDQYVDGSIDAIHIADANVTPVKYNIVEARTATSDGLTTAVISDTTTHVTVTSANADYIIVLPTPTPGRHVVIHNGATGYELRSSAPATVLINGGTGGASVESAIPANSTVFMTCVTATAWKGFFMDADGDLAKVEAAAA